MPGVQFSNHCHLSFLLLEYSLLYHSSEAVTHSASESDQGGVQAYSIFELYRFVIDVLVAALGQKRS